MTIPRPEHPRPQFCRPSWLNLNGTWTYRMDPGQSGVEAGWPSAQRFDDPIIVPFCPESSLSGIAHTDFIPSLWYHRTVDIPDDWHARDILLHAGAVDFDCEVYIDGARAGRHSGGTVGFTVDITGRVMPGHTHHLVFRVCDDTRGGVQPGGKQSQQLKSHGCRYTRTTGIWQTVWLEAVHPNGLNAVHMVPDVDGERLLLTPTFRQHASGTTFKVTADFEGTQVAQVSCAALSGATVVLPLKQPRLWQPGAPNLYDLTLTIQHGNEILDTVTSYAGMRKVHIEGNRVFLNNKPVYQRLVLDQGFYPDGIWTAPSDEALKNDIELSMAAGFNGARLHQKVFEERFHYWADKLGYLTWAESSSWGGHPDNPVYARNFLSEWTDILLRDRNHPSIIAWTPFNETRRFDNRDAHARTHEEAYRLCKALDPTRPVNDTSGYVHTCTDLWTVHNYEQDPSKLREALTPGEDGAVWRNVPDLEPDYSGQPYLVDEYGGIKWNPQDKQRSEESWGYGRTPQSLDEFYHRLEELTDVILSLDHICGYCYTQLTDVEQEQNGILFYDRRPKFNINRLRAVFTKKPDWAEL